LMHFSAKLNVFLGVRNFRVEFLPRRMHYIDRLLTKRTSNAIFPVSILLATSVGLTLIYQGIAPGTSPAHTTGYLFVATMIGLGVIEHWMLVLPLPSALVGFEMRPVTPEGVLAPITVNAAMMTQAPYEKIAAPTNADIPQTRRIKRTYTFERDHGPFVVDVWDARNPTANTPVMLVHGWGGTGTYWRDTAFDLSRTVKVIVPDLPGTGRSLPIHVAHDMYDQVDALEWLLDELDLERVQLVGHSMGGAMSILLTERQPRRVERVHISSMSFFASENQKRIYKAVMAAYRFTMPFRPNWLASVPYTAQIMANGYFYNIPQDEELLQAGLRDYLNLDGPTAMACARNATDDFITEAGARIDVPVMLVAPRFDHANPTENFERTAALIPNCQLVWIEDSGHLPMVEKPSEFMATLTAFLNVSSQLEGNRS
ncbi:MAG: alpha/beta fold hydrolase, partial [Chloroflexota bacterium]